MKNMQVTRASVLVCGACGCTPNNLIRTNHSNTEYRMPAKRFHSVRISAAELAAYKDHGMRGVPRRRLLDGIVSECLYVLARNGARACKRGCKFSVLGTRKSLYPFQSAHPMLDGQMMRRNLERSKKPFHYFTRIDSVIQQAKSSQKLTRENT